MPRFCLSEESEDEVECEDDIEPSHPLGFSGSSSPWGKTWFSLDPPSQSSYLSGRTTYAFDDNDDFIDRNSMVVQSYPPLSSYIRSDQVSTTALLQLDRESHLYHQKQRNLFREQEDDDLYYSADDEDSDDDTNENTDVALLTIQQNNSSPMTPRLISTMQKVLSVALTPPSTQQKRRVIEQDIQRRVELEHQKIDEECRRNNEVLGELVLQSKRETDVILKKRQAEEERICKQQKAKEERELEIREKAEKTAKILKAKEDQEASEKQQAEQKQQETTDNAAAEKVRRQQEKQAQAKKSIEYIDRAKKLVGQLVQMRMSVEPFEKSKAVGKRRLGMKKIAKGKVNTLNDNSQKIREIATEISQAISKYEQEDEQIKQQIQLGTQGFTKEMAVGRRYFVDLLASTIMTRVQAESFGGTNGDGFPLAAMVSIVSVENKHIIQILAAHMYTVCPTSIPTLPSPPVGASEDEVMTGLGMQRNKKTGEFESFPQFLARTENIISFMAAVQSSLPISHPLMGGNQGAIIWLKRFIDLLPPAPTSPLPLITAPVLGAFLTGAGHMLAKTHADTFRNILGMIQDDIVNRLDEGEMGKPSKIRLNKVIEGGFDHFLKNLPSKAISDCYYGATEDSRKNANITSFGGTIGAEEEVGTKRQQQNGNGGHNSFNANPFGVGGSNNVGGARTQMNNASSNQQPFGSNTGSTPGFRSTSPFAPTINSSPFGGSAPAPVQSPFGMASATSSGFGAQASVAPFGQAPSGGFGGNTFGIPSPASGGVVGFGGQPAQASSGFGAASSTGFSAVPASSSGFGKSNNTGFEGHAATNNPFGGGVPAPASPFGGGFGGNQNNTNFSGGGRHRGGGANAAKKLCKFYAKGNCRFGNKCNYSHETGGSQGFKPNNNFYR